MKLLDKAILGSVIVVVIQLLSQTRYYFIAGLVPLFPTFSLIAHYIVGTEQTIVHLKKTIMLGIFSLIPYLIYLLSLYSLVDKFKLSSSLLRASLYWTVSAIILVVLWERVYK
ncbi:MAG: GlpM family protein [Crocosphaera sp.]|nr:GlpM family protein [Crocosphaera sp.]